MPATKSRPSAATLRDQIIFQSGVLLFVDIAAVELICDHCLFYRLLSDLVALCTSYFEVVGAIPNRTLGISKF